MFNYTHVHYLRTFRNYIGVGDIQIPVLGAIAIIKCTASLQSSFICLSTVDRLITSRNYLIYAQFSKRLVNKTSLPSTNVSGVIRSVCSQQEETPSHHWSVDDGSSQCKGCLSLLLSVFAYHCYSLSAHLTFLIRKAMYRAHK